MNKIKRYKQQEKFHKDYCSKCKHTYIEDKDNEICFNQTETESIKSLIEGLEWGWGGEIQCAPTLFYIRKGGITFAIYNISSKY